MTTEISFITDKQSRTWPWNEIKTVSQNTLANFIVAGGSCREGFLHVAVTGDCDIWALTENDYNILYAYYLQSNYELTFESNTCKMCSFKYRDLKLQIIFAPSPSSTALFCTAEQIVDQFDFTICMFWYLPRISTFMCSSKALEHTVSKQLVLHSLTYPVSTLKRLFKYKDKGFEVTPHILQDIVKRIHKAGIDQLPIKDSIYIATE